VFAGPGQISYRYFIILVICPIKVHVIGPSPVDPAVPSQTLFQIISYSTGSAERTQKSSLSDGTAPRAGKDDADQPRTRQKVPAITKSCPDKGNVKTQFISTLFNGSGYTAFVLNGNGDSDVHDNDKHADSGRFAAGPPDPDGYAKR
jgi:hypothetical protein